MAINWNKIIETVEIYFNTINHIIIGAVTIYITWMCWNIGPTARSYHIWLCTIGYQLLMAEAILAFYQTNDWSRIHTRRTKNNIHWIMQLVGSILSLAGCIIEYYDRRDHLESIHSLTGLISMIFLGIGLINGIAALWAPELKKIFKPVYSKFFHNLVGILCFIIGMVSIIYSYDTGRVIRASTVEIRLALKWAAGITTVLSLFGALRSLYGQVMVSFNITLPAYFSKLNLASESNESVLEHEKI